MTLVPEDIVKLLLAVLAGGLIGLEREFRDKAAGFRTVIFICLGATLFTIFSVKLAGPGDPTRIAANIVTGVGFLGAGAILRDGGRVVGLTTAATVWLAAALGIGIGAGHYLLTGVAVILVLLILWLFPFLEHRVDRLREARRYEVLCDAEAAPIVEELFAHAALRTLSRQWERSAEGLTLTWFMVGPPAAHERLLNVLRDHPAVKALRA